MALPDVDLQIADMFRCGMLTSEIARATGLSLVDVIGRIRSMDLQMPSMATRMQRSMLPVQAETEVVEDAAPRSGETAATEAVVRRPVLSSSSAFSPRSARSVPVRKAGSAPNDDEVDEEDDQPRRAGVPKGWLVTEDEFDRAFAGARFETLYFRPAPLRRVG